MSRERVEYTVVAYLPGPDDPARQEAAQSAWEDFKLQVAVLRTGVRFRAVDFGEATSDEPN